MTKKKEKKKPEKPKKAPNKRGRKSKWNPEFIELARVGRRKDLTIKELAKSFGVSQSLIFGWMNEFPEFLEAINQSRVIADCKVENRLYDTAVGFYYTEEMAFKVKDVKGDEIVEVVKVEKFQGGNFQAQRHWLSNRSRRKALEYAELQVDLWQEKIKHEVTGKDGGAIEHKVDMSDWSDDKLRELIEGAMALKEEEDGS